MCERLGILKLRSNFGVMRVCMGKRNLAQSCVLYEVTRQTSQVHVLKLRSGRQLWNYEGLYGEEEFGPKLCLIWSNATTRHNLYSVSLYGEEEFRPKMCLIWSNSQQQDNFGIMKVCMGEEEFDSRLMLSMPTGAHVRQENSVVHIPLCNSLTRQVIMKKQSTKVFTMNHKTFG